MIRLMPGDAFSKLDELEEKSIDCCFTSPDPPFHNEVGIGALGSFQEYHRRLLDIFKKVYRVLKDDGTLFVQMGDYHNGGNLTCTPFIHVLMMSKDWIFRSDIIWHRPNEIQQDDLKRFKRDTEHVFFFAKSMDHYFNPKYCNTSLFSFPVRAREEGEFESGFPEGLIEVCIESGCPPGGIVLDPFADSGTTGLVALRSGRGFVGIEIEEHKIPKILKRLKKR